MANDGTRRSPSGSGYWCDRRGSPAECSGWSPAQPLGLRRRRRGRKFEAAQERARRRVVLVQRQDPGNGVAETGWPPHLAVRRSLPRRGRRGAARRARHSRRARLGREVEAAKRARRRVGRVERHRQRGSKALLARVACRLLVMSREARTSFEASKRKVR